MHEAAVQSTAVAMPTSPWTSRRSPESITALTTWRVALQARPRPGMRQSTLNHGMQRALMGRAKASNLVTINLLHRRMLHRTISSLTGVIMPKQPPVAVCFRCGHFAFNLQLIGQRCYAHPLGRGQCLGLFTSKLSDDDWQTCHHCQSEGCEECQNSGHLVFDRMPTAM